MRSSSAWSSSALRLRPGGMFGADTGGRKLAGLLPEKLAWWKGEECEVMWVESIRERLGDRRGFWSRCGGHSGCECRMSFMTSGGRRAGGDGRRWWTSRTRWTRGWWVESEFVDGAAGRWWKVGGCVVRGALYGCLDERVPGLKWPALGPAPRSSSIQGLEWTALHSNARESPCLHRTRPKHPPAPRPPSQRRCAALAHTTAASPSTSERGRCLPLEADEPPAALVVPLPLPLPVPFALGPRPHPSVARRHGALRSPLRRCPHCLRTRPRRSYGSSSTRGPPSQ